MSFVQQILGSWWPSLTRVNPDDHGPSVLQDIYEYMHLTGAWDWRVNARWDESGYLSLTAPKLARRLRTDATARMIFLSIAIRHGYIVDVDGNIVELLPKQIRRRMKVARGNPVRSYLARKKKARPAYARMKHKKLGLVFQREPGDETLAGRIEHVLREQRISQRELSRRSGLDPIHIGKFLHRARRSPKATLEAPTVASIANGAGVSLRWLMTGDGSRNNPRESRQTRT